MPFGIPGVQPDPQAIIQQLASNAGQLQVVVSALTDDLGESLTSADQLIQLVMSSATKALAKQANANTKNLSTVVDALGADLVSSASVTQSLLDDLARQLGESDAADTSLQPDAVLSPFTATMPPAPRGSTTAPGTSSAPSAWEVEAETIGDGEETAQVVSATLTGAQSQPWVETDPADDTQWLSQLMAAAPGFAGMPGILEDGLPIPGSPRFCEHADDVVQFFREVGAALRPFFESLEDPAPFIAFLEAHRPDPKRNWASKQLSEIFYEALMYVARVGADVWRWVATQIKLVYHWQARLFTQFDTDALLGISLCQTVLSGCERFRFGTDAAVWLTADIGVRLQALRDVLTVMHAYICPMNVVSPAQATKAWLDGYISTELRDCVWRLNGYMPAIYEPYALASQERVDARTAVMLARLDGVPRDLQEDELRRRGWIDGDQRESWLRSYDRPATETQWMHWARSGAMSTDYVSRYGLGDGFSALWDSRAGTEMAAQGHLKEYVHAQYVSQRPMPGYAECRTLLHRLGNRAGLNDPSFTEDDLRGILTARGHSDWYTERLVSTAYAALGVGLVDQLYREGLVDIERLRRAHLDAGVHPDEIPQLTALAEIQRTRHRWSASAGWTPASIAAAQVQGVMAIQQMDRMYELLGLTADEARLARDRAQAALLERVVTRARSRVLTQTVTTVRQAIAVGVMDSRTASAALQTAGWPQQYADGLAQLESLTARTGSTREAIRAVRHALLNGEVDAQYVAGALQQLGIVPDAVVRYISTWAAQQTPRRKRRTATQIATDVASGQLDTPTAIARLANLGYDDADTRLWLADAAGKAGKIAAQQRAAADKAHAAAEKDLISAAKAADMLKKEAVAALKREQPPAKLQKWARMGLISLAYFTQRMSLYGWDGPSIAEWWTEACATKGAACDTTTTGQQTVPRGVGGATGTDA